MPGLFSFTGNDWDAIFRHPGILLPGIEQVSVIYWDGAEEKVRAETRNRDGVLEEDHKELTGRAEGKLKLQKFRSINKPYEWIRLSESPLQDTSGKPSETDLFSEMQNTILVLRYRNETDSRYDAVLIYFHRKLNQFGGILPEKVLSTENKLVIGHILFNYFKNIYTLNRQNNGVLQSLQHSVRSIARENAKLREDIRLMAYTHEEMIVNLSQHYLQEISERYRRDYTFSEDAVSKLKSYRGNIRHLGAIIEQGVVFCENLLFNSPDGPVTLDAMAISFENFMVDQEAAPVIKRIDSRESRAMQLLDKLEKAALVLQGRGVPLTGANLGAAFDQPITAPAITDAIKKHRTGILQLLEKFPQKWETIREGFRPVAKLLRSQPGILASEESA